MMELPIWYILYDDFLGDAQYIWCLIVAMRSETQRNLDLGKLHTRNILFNAAEHWWPDSLCMIFIIKPTISSSRCVSTPACIVIGWELMWQNMVADLTKPRSPESVQQTSHQCYKTNFQKYKQICWCSPILIPCLRNICVDKTSICSQYTLPSH